jgi:hypothetical protein
MRRFADLGGLGEVSCAKSWEISGPVPAPRRLRWAGVPRLGAYRPSSVPRGVADRPRAATWSASLGGGPPDEQGTYNLYTSWPERKRALGLWHEKLAPLENEGDQRAA